MDLTVLKQSPIAHLCFAMTFFTSGLIVNLVQAVFYVGLRPFNKTLYRKINYYLCYTLYSRKYTVTIYWLIGLQKFYFVELVCVAEWWANVDLQLYIDKDDWNKYFGKEHGYCIMNHSYEIDWLMGWMACEKMGVLGVSIQALSYFFLVIKWITN